MLSGSIFIYILLKTTFDVEIEKCLVSLTPKCYVPFLGSIYMIEKEFSFSLSHDFIYSGFTTQSKKIITADVFMQNRLNVIAS